MIMPIEDMQPRAQHYCHGLGDAPFKGYQYIAWVCGRWDEFAAERGIATDAARRQLTHEFDAWLAARCGCQEGEK